MLHWKLYVYKTWSLVLSSFCNLLCHKGQNSVASSVDLHVVYVSGFRTEWCRQW